MSPSSGTFDTEVTFRSWTRPPMTMVLWSFTTTLVFTLRLAVVGPRVGLLATISSCDSSMSMRTMSPSWICGLIFSLRSTFCRWMGR